jgi:hypothetical protein
MGSVNSSSRVLSLSPDVKPQRKSPAIITDWKMRELGIHG